MCGIAAIINLTSQGPIDRDALFRAVSRMERRGPDDCGFHHSQHASFGHRRLSVIDIKGGHQPFVHSATGCVLVYNGELYNSAVLRDELQACGHTFSTHCDTEVLFYACLEWGKECLNRLNGMFAFVFYDPRNGTVFAARDRVGVKPFFYSMCKGQLMVASSMNALFCLLHETPRLDSVALTHYLTTIRTTLGHQTLVQNVSTLQPGEYLTAQRGNAPVTVKKYWEIPVISPEGKQQPANFNEAAARIHEMVRESIGQRLISDVPLGGFLSGGLDSTIIASLASQMTHHNYNAYSVGYDESGYNEWEYIEEVARSYNMWCKQIHLDPTRYTTDWSFLINQKGLPLSTPNEVPIYHLAHALKNDFTVALSGEGADEIFGGYTIPYFSAFDFDRADHSPGTCLDAKGQALQRLYGQTWLPDHVTHHFLLNSWLDTSFRQKLLHPEHNKTIQMHAFYTDLYQRFNTCTTFDQHMHVHARINLEGLLFRVDSSTMAASVEARVPFTDHRIVEYLFSLPDSFKIDWVSDNARQQAQGLNIQEIDQKRLVETKRLLRHAFHEEVPIGILKRRKMSFPVPIHRFVTENRDQIREQIMQSSLYDVVFQKDTIAALLRDSNVQTASFRLWPILNLCFWADQFGVTA